MISLFYLYKLILINEYRKKFFSKDTFVGVLIIVSITILSISFGYFLGQVVIYTQIHPELNLGDPFYYVRLFFLEAILPVIMIKSAGSRPLRQININTLRLFPVTKQSIFLFDINIGIFDFASLFLVEFLVTFIFSAGGFSISATTALIFILFILSLVYFINVLSELLFSIIRFLSSLPKIRTVIVTIIIFILIYSFAIKHLDWKSVIINNPLSWNVSSVFSLTIFNESHWLYNNILFNIFSSLIALLLTISIKIIHANLFLGHTVQKRKASKENKIRLNSFLNIFPLKMQPFLEKDIKYIYRSSRALSAIIIEFLFLVYICYMHYTNGTHFNKIYFPAFFLITIPVIMWDFFLSNSWGLERRGFGFYLYSNIDYNELEQSKNLAFIIVRSPIIILISLTFAIMFSFKLLPIIIILYTILNLLSLSFSNIVSVKNPIPVEFKESSFTEKKQQKISLIGLVGLFLYMLFSALIVFMFYKFGPGLIFYSVIFFILLSLILFYKRMTSYASVLLFNQKETIYKKLIKI